MIISCIAVFIFSYAITFFMRQYSLRKRLLDIPNERSSHVEPTPRSGGVGIVLSFMTALIICHPLPADLNYALIGGGLAIAILGYCDDLYGLSNRIRFTAQLCVALWAIYWLHGFSTIDLGTWKFTLNSVGSLIGVIAIIWLINLYNFMDGIDGLAGSEGFFTALASGLALLSLAHDNLAFVMLLLAAAIGGFTTLNWPPAKIFLGDVGSCFLGYIFAVFGIATINMEKLPLNFWLIIMAVFICDATFTVVHRGLQGKRWYHAHREHAYQHLNIYGVTHKQITLAVSVINVFVLLPIAYLTLNWPHESFWLLSFTLLGLFVIWFYIKRLPLLRENV